MEHKGIVYTVLQTASPTGYRWTVDWITTRTKTGVSFSKGNAILTALREIDKALDAARKIK